ncbi:MAG: hypothetical protein EP343_24635 [Deltaproteobacteria bacterium]|nr:MAG: hypothetical protein EP343_24635 [Deltaproteobacteria bacterium]
MMKHYRAFWILLGLFVSSTMGSGCGCAITGESGVEVKTAKQGFYTDMKVRVAFVATGCLFSDFIPRICHLEKQLGPGGEYVHAFREMHTNRGLFIACRPNTLIPNAEDLFSKSAMIAKTKDGWFHTITIESSQQIKVETRDNFGKIVEDESKTLTECEL